MQMPNVTTKWGITKMKITKSQLKRIIKEELQEVYSDKQRRWACAQMGDDFKGERELTKKQAKEMCSGPMLDEDWEGDAL